MRGWLGGEYSAVLFELDGATVGYSLFRDDEGRGVYLRQFFVARERRREGIGRRAFELLATEALRPGTRIVIEVLCGNERALAFWSAVGFADYARTLVRGHPPPTA